MKKKKGIEQDVLESGTNRKREDGRKTREGRWRPEDKKARLNFVLKSSLVLAFLKGLGNSFTIPGE